jgi:hypothetical protein
LVNLFFSCLHIEKDFHQIAWLGIPYFDLKCNSLGFDVDSVIFFSGLVKQRADVSRLREDL